MTFRRHMVHWLVVLAWLPPLTVSRGQATSQPQAVAFDPALVTSLRFRYVGPVGNRVSSVVGIPGDPNTYYAGAASGGIWKTTDAGIHWAPIFDDQPVSSIGALAVAPSDPNIVWAGTGEPWIRSHISLGIGMYKSTDAGRSWTHVGLDAPGGTRVGRIAIDPTNPQVVFVAMQGNSYGPQPERGVYRTQDGGTTWQRVLFVDENTGAIDVLMHPTNPQVMFAAMWQLEMHTWGRQSGGPGSGIFKSTDGGTTWTRLTGHGLPSHPVGKIGLAISRSNPNRVYALIETADGVPTDGQPADNGELWRSDDGGASWTVVSFNRDLACRQPYYTRMAVAPDRPDETYFLCATFNRSLDGGTTVSAGARGGGGGRAGRQGAPGGGPGAGPGGRGARVDSGPPMTAPGGDNHDMWIDPTNGDRMAVANDAGVSISTTRSRTWLHVSLPIAQIYHATVDNQIPYNVYGNKQDGPSYRGPSNSRTGGTIARSEWHGVEGGESGWATPDPVDPNIVWSTASGSGSRGGIVIRFDERTRQGQNVEVWPLSTGGYPAADVQYRVIWDAPFTISPHDHNKIYFGSQYVHMTMDGGRSWHVISPDLTRNDKSKQQISGGLTPDDIGVEYGDVVYAIAESRAQKDLIWVGTNDGLVQLTRDGGKTWSNVTANIPGIPTWGSVRSIEPSRYDAGTAYLIVDAHQENNRDPWVYKTSDFGKTWKLIVNGLPKNALGYAHIIKEDPVRRGLLYLGTESALYVSFDDGEQWQPLQNNLPHAPVYGLAIQEHFNDLVVATYGRGFYILDDLTPLQKMAPQVLASNAYLFAPRAAYRFRDRVGNVSYGDDPTAGTNPTYGADINYWLKSAPSAADAPKIAILDAAGKTVRTLRGTREAGMNRVYWDLRNEPSKAPRLRTKPMYDPEFQMAADGTRSAPGFGSVDVLMPPGRYTVRLTAGGQTLTQPLDVLKDPNELVTVTDIHASVSLLLALQNDVNTTADLLNTIESVRAQLETLSAQVANDAANAQVQTSGDALEQKFITLEQKLQDLRQNGQGQDEVRWPVKVGGQLGWLSNGVASSDFAPTTQQGAVHQILDKQVRDAHTELQGLMNRDLVSFNNMLKQKGLKTIDATLPVVVF